MICGIILHFNITEEPNPLDDTEKESTTEEAIPTVPEEEDETTATTPDTLSKQPDRMVFCSVGQATRIHCTIMKSVIPHLQRSLTKKVNTPILFRCSCNFNVCDDNEFSKRMVFKENFARKTHQC